MNQDVRGRERTFPPDHDELRQNSVEALRVLNERAAIAAAQAPVTVSDEKRLSVVVLPVGDEFYALSAAVAREIQPLRQWTRIPNAPAYAVGAINIRGRIFPVIDVRWFLGLPPGQPSQRSFVAVADLPVDNGIEVVALLCDGRPSVRSIAESDLRPWRTESDPLNEDLVRGITDDFVVVLETSRLLQRR